MREKIMKDATKFYIGGQWVDPIEPRAVDVINPADESVTGRVSLGTERDVDAAVRAARAAFASWSSTSREERLAVIDRVIDEFKARHQQFGDLISEEIGAPLSFARKFHAGLGLTHLKVARRTLEAYDFDTLKGATLVTQVPIGVCALITPWNYPINQIAVKVAPALATGCTMVLKPSELSPYSAALWAEVMDAAGVPPGVFNLINGEGPVVGRALSAHPDVDMVSFTGSTAAGIDVARTAAGTVKRVAQELGGKSANVILDGPSFEKAVESGIRKLMTNAGQTCSAPSRMLVPADRMADAIAVAERVGATLRVGQPESDPDLGPVVSKQQWSRIQGYIESGVRDGARLVIGGAGLPDGLDKGFYVRPTVFADVRNDMQVAREEIFGPVLCMIGFTDIDDAIAIANDTDYGIAAYVSGDDSEAVAKVANGLRAALVSANGTSTDPSAPFGGFKRSGNGREYGAYGFHEYLEYKAMVGVVQAGQAEPPAAAQPAGAPVAA